MDKNSIAPSRHGASKNKPPTLPNKPVAIDPKVDPKHLQLNPRPLNGAAPAMR